MNKVATSGVLIVVALITAAILTACESCVHYCHLAYMPWSVEEYQLFGLTKEQIISKYSAHFSNDGSSITGNGYDYNLDFDKAHRVRAVQRYFHAECNRPRYGPWLQSQSDALNYCAEGLAGYHDPKSEAKLATVKEMLGKINTSKECTVSRDKLEDPANSTQN